MKTGIKIHLKWENRGLILRQESDFLDVKNEIDIRSMQLNVYEYEKQKEKADQLEKQEKEFGKNETPHKSERESNTENCNAFILLFKLIINSYHIL